MKLIIRWARWFGLARAVCIVLLFALVPLRVIDPRPLEEVRLRAFDLFQVLRPREQTARPQHLKQIERTPRTSSSGRGSMTRSGTSANTSTMHTARAKPTRPAVGSCSSLSSPARRSKEDEFTSRGTNA